MLQGVAKDLSERAGKIKLLILDVDGVLTDGRIIYDNFNDEFKFFDVQDGFGLTLLHRAGIRITILTAKKSKAIKRRAKDIHASRLYQDARNKLSIYKKILGDFKVKDEEVCFIGDDLIDLPVLKKVGFAVCVKNAVEDVKPHCHYVTKRSGGRGAVREVVELILKSQDKWAEIVEKYEATS